jgi:hypothetical protein
MCRLMIHGRHSLYVVLTRATFFFIVFPRTGTISTQCLFIYVRVEKKQKLNMMVN